MKIEGTKATTSEVLLEVMGGEVCRSLCRMSLTHFFFLQSNTFVFDLDNFGEAKSIALRMSDGAKSTWQPSGVWAS